MKKLHFEYYMQIDYSVEISRCNFTIKCIPKDNERQKIGQQDIEIYPAISYQTGADGLGNLQIYGVNEQPHKTFYFKITGDAMTGMADYEEKADGNIAMIFNHPHGLNVAGDNIIKYFNQIKPVPGKNALEQTEEIMHCLHRDFTYQPDTTTVKTTAEEAFTLGCGVCQDYAHVFIALLHLAKIPARYVTGLIVGEGASHAWVEVLSEGRWYGFDPTNDVRVKDEHIKIGIGRDANDCMINRGIMHGGGTQTQTVRVSVTQVQTKERL